MPINDALSQIISKEGHNKELTPYLMFKYAIKTEILEKKGSKDISNLIKNRLIKLYPDNYKCEFVQKDIYW